MTKLELLKIAKPILFNTEMVKAILEGRKTVTRRVAKFDNYISCDEESGKYTLLEEDGGYSEGWTIQELKLNGYIKPPYHKGDILYVRETFFVDDCTPDCAGRMNEDECPFIRVGDKCYGYKTQYVGGRFGGIKWRPSIHMPKEAARIFLKVTDVRCERLQDITVEQALKEGFNSAYEFNVLWNSTIKKQDLDRYGWQANPWVWVYEFEKVLVEI